MKECITLKIFGLTLKIATIIFFALFLITYLTQVSGNIYFDTALIVYFCFFILVNFISTIAKLFKYKPFNLNFLELILSIINVFIVSFIIIMNQSLQTIEFYLFLTLMVGYSLYILMIKRH